MDRVSQTIKCMLSGKSFQVLEVLKAKLRPKCLICELKSEEVELARFIIQYDFSVIKHVSMYL